MLTHPIDTFEEDLSSAARKARLNIIKRDRLVTASNLDANTQKLMKGISATLTMYVTDRNIDLEEFARFMVDSLRHQVAYRESKLRTGWACTDFESTEMEVWTQTHYPEVLEVLKRIRINEEWVSILFCEMNYQTPMTEEERFALVV